MNEIQLEFFFKLISIYLKRKGDEKKRKAKRLNEIQKFEFR